MLRGHAVGYVERLPTHLNFLQRAVEKLSNVLREGCRPKSQKGLPDPRPVPLIGEEALRRAERRQEFRIIN